MQSDLAMPLFIENDNNCEDYFINHHKLYIKSHIKFISTASLSKSNSLLATGSLDKTIRIWNYPQRIKISTFSNHTKPITSLLFSDKEKTLYSSSEDGMICIWDIWTSKLKGCLLAKDSVISICMAKKSKVLLSSLENEDIVLWDIKNSSQIMIFSCNYQVRSIVFIPLNNDFLLLTEYQNVIVWNLHIKKFKGSSFGHIKNVTCLACSNDRTFTISASRDCL